MVEPRRSHTRPPPPRLTHTVDGVPDTVTEERISIDALKGYDGAAPLSALLYRPKSTSLTQGTATTARPFVLGMHGGGFLQMSALTHRSIWARVAARTGAIVIAVDYRQGTKHRWPTPPLDCLAALHWVHQHASDLGVDTKRMSVMGDSAGGTLSAVLALWTRDGGPPPSAMASFPRWPGPPLVAQILVYPATDFRNDADYASYHSVPGELLSLETMNVFRNVYTGHLSQETQSSESVSPLLATRPLAGLPPALVITAERDILRDEGVAYAARLKADGTVVRAVHYPGMVHGFFNGAVILTAAKGAMNECVKALVEAFSTSSS
jgi:acetyl esterase